MHELDGISVQDLKDKFVAKHKAQHEMESTEVLFGKEMNEQVKERLPAFGNLKRFNLAEK